MSSVKPPVRQHLERVSRKLELSRESVTCSGFTGESPNYSSCESVAEYKVLGAALYTKEKMTASIVLANVLWSEERNPTSRVDLGTPCAVDT